MPWWGNLLSQRNILHLVVVIHIIFKMLFVLVAWRNARTTLASYPFFFCSKSRSQFKQWSVTQRFSLVLSAFPKISYLYLLLLLTKISEKKQLRPLNVHYYVIQTFVYHFSQTWSSWGGGGGWHEMHRYDLGPLAHHTDPLIIKQKHCFGKVPADWSHSPQAKHTLL